LTIYAGDTAMLTISSGNATTYTWNNSLGTGTSKKVSPITTTQYIVTGSTVKSCSSSDTLLITVKPLIPSTIANFNITSNTILSKSFHFSGFTNTLITKWYWTFGDGSYSTTKDSTSHIYTTSGLYNVCLNVFSGSSGLASDTCKSIIIGVPKCQLSAMFSVDTTTLINNLAKFTNLSTGSYKLSSWDFGDGNTSLVVNPKHLYSSAGYYLVKLSIKADSCIDEYDQLIKVGNPTCHADFSYVVDPATLSVTFSNASNNAANYFWLFGDGNQSKLQNPSHIFFSPGTYTISLTTSNSDGTCYDNVIKTIQVGTVSCSAQFNWYVDSISSTGYFASKALSNTTNFNWKFGDGTTSTNVNPFHTFAAPGYYSVQLTVYDTIAKCMDNKKQTILIGNISHDCSANFIYIADSTTKSVKFVDNSTGVISKRVWNFGDGSSPSFSKNTTHQYNISGYFNVCLTIGNNFGIINQSCKRIEVAANAKINCYSDFQYTISPGTRNVNFLNTSQGVIKNYAWSFGDGDTLNIQNTSHLYKVPKLYLVSLQVKNSATGCNNKHYNLLNVNKKDTFAIAFGYDPKDFNAKADGYPVDFTGAGVGDHARLRWDFGDSTATDTTSTSPTHIYQYAGYYEVCLTDSDQITGQVAQGCELISTTSLCTSDNIKPVASCKNVTITLNSSGRASIMPDTINNGSTDNCGISTILINNSSFTTANIGKNNVKLVVTDYSGNSDTCVATVTVQKGASLISENKVVDLNVYPNPFEAKFEITYQLLDNTVISIRIYDLVGKPVMNIFEGNLSTGQKSYILDATSLQSGAYILQLKTANGYSYKQMIIKK
jgi:PKD repeat protein